VHAIPWHCTLQETLVKIDKRITPPAVSKASTKGAKGAGKTAVPATDSLTLTESTTRMRAMEADLAKVDIADASKIKSVKDALAKGTFTVDAEVVADRLIDHSKESLRKRPHKK
jgi:negative regulator of flagellin synthesis FlgM